MQIPKALSFHQTISHFSKSRHELEHGSMVEYDISANNSPPDVCSRSTGWIQHCLQAFRVFFFSPDGWLREVSQCVQRPLALTPHAARLPTPPELKATGPPHRGCPPLQQRNCNRFGRRTRQQTAPPPVPRHLCARPKDAKCTLSLAMCQRLQESLSLAWPSSTNFPSTDHQTGPSVWSAQLWVPGLLAPPCQLQSNPIHLVGLPQRCPSGHQRRIQCQHSTCWEWREGTEANGPLCDLTDALCEVDKRGHTTSSRCCSWTFADATFCHPCLGCVGSLSRCLTLRPSSGLKPVNPHQTQSTCCLFHRLETSRWSGGHPLDNPPGNIRVSDLDHRQSAQLPQCAASRILSEFPMPNPPRVNGIDAATCTSGSIVPMWRTLLRQRASCSSWCLAKSWVKFALAPAQNRMSNHATWTLGTWGIISNRASCSAPFFINCAWTNSTCPTGAPKKRLASPIWLLWWVVLPLLARPLLDSKSGFCLGERKCTPSCPIRVPTTWTLEALLMACKWHKHHPRRRRASPHPPTGTSLRPEPDTNPSWRAKASMDRLAPRLLLAARDAPCLHHPPREMLMVTRRTSAWTGPVCRRQPCLPPLWTWYFGRQGHYQWTELWLPDLRLDNVCHALRSSPCWTERMCRCFTQFRILLGDGPCHNAPEDITCDSSQSDRWDHFLWDVALCQLRRFTQKTRAWGTVQKNSQMLRCHPGRSSCCTSSLHRGGKGHGLRLSFINFARVASFSLNLVTCLDSCKKQQELWDNSEFTWRALGSRPRSQRDGQSVHECGHGVQERGSGLFFGLVGRVHCSSGELEMTRHNDGSFFCEPMLTIVISHFKNSVNCMWTAQCTAESCKKDNDNWNNCKTSLRQATITGPFKFLLSCGDICDVHKSIHLADRFPPATL